MNLFIHAPDRVRTFIFLEEDGKIIARIRPKFSYTKMADILKHVHTLLEKNNVQPPQLRGIVVLSGPGQFSFLRSGIIIANTFAWALHIPVIGVYGDEFLSEQEFVTVGLSKRTRAKKKFTPVIPRYGKEPNITQSKKQI